MKPVSIWCRRKAEAASGGHKYLPVTQGVAGSSPVRSANIQKARISNDSGFRRFGEVRIFHSGSKTDMI